jgi:hypothetical protein
MTPVFTLAEANQMLPLVRVLAHEMTERRTQRSRLQRVRAELDAAQTPEGLVATLSDLDARIYEHDEAMRHATKELHDLGLTLLRTYPLTIHFPGRARNGDVVFCWQEGEESVMHGHACGEEEDPRRPLRVKSNDPANHGTH